MPEWTKPFYGVSHYGEMTDRRRGSVADYRNFATVNLYDIRKGEYSDTVCQRCVEHETIFYKESSAQAGGNYIETAKRYVEKFVNGE